MFRFNDALELQPRLAIIRIAPTNFDLFILGRCLPIPPSVVLSEMI